MFSSLDFWVSMDDYSDYLYGEEDSPKSKGDVPEGEADG